MMRARTQPSHRVAQHLRVRNRTKLRFPIALRLARLGRIPGQNTFISAKNQRRTTQSKHQYHRGQSSHAVPFRMEWVDIIYTATRSPLPASTELVRAIATRPKPRATSLVNEIEPEPPEANNQESKVGSEEGRLVPRFDHSTLEP